REIRQVGEYGGRHLRGEADDETDDLVEGAQHLAAPEQADCPSYVPGTYGSPLSPHRLRGRGGPCTPEGFIGEQRLRRAPRRQQIGEQRPDRRLADAPVPGRGAARDRVDEAIPRIAATCTQEGSDAAGAPCERVEVPPLVAASSRGRLKNLAYSAQLIHRGPPTRSEVGNYRLRPEGGSERMSENMMLKSPGR